MTELAGFEIKARDSLQDCTYVSDQLLNKSKLRPDGILNYFVSLCQIRGGKRKCDGLSLIVLKHLITPTLFIFNVKTMSSGAPGHTNCAVPKCRNAYTVEYTTNIWQNYLFFSSEKAAAHTPHLKPLGSEKKVPTLQDPPEKDKHPVSGDTVEVLWPTTSRHASPS